MLQLWRGARSGHGGLTLCALSRTLPLDESEKCDPNDSSGSCATERVSGADCVTGTLTYTIPTAAATTFTYTMPGMPDNTDVEMTSIPNVGLVLRCGGLSLNGQMVCAQTLIPGPPTSYQVYVSNAVTGDDCKGLAVSNGTLTMGTSATGCPAVFVR
jgi:hypothetical protein